MRVVPDVEQTFGGYFTRGRPTAERDVAAVREADAAAVGALIRPLRSDQVKRVRCCGGASPPGRRPLRTSRTGRPLRRQRCAGRSESLGAPALGEADDRDRGRRPLPRRADRGRARRGAARRDAEGALDGERRTREQTAGVLPVLDRGPGEPQGHLPAAGEPGAELDRAPVVLAAAERDEHGPGVAFGPTATATSHGAVRSSTANSGSSRSSGPATSTRSTSCSAASRATSSPGELLVKTAVRATTPRARSASHCGADVGGRGRERRPVLEQAGDDQLPLAAGGRAAPRARAATRAGGRRYRRRGSTAGAPAPRRGRAIDPVAGSTAPGPGASGPARSRAARRAFAASSGTRSSASA